MNVYDEALKVAKRSSQKKYRTGAVIMQGNIVLGNGWSHVPEFSRLRSMHAEIHALARARHLPLKHFTNVVIYVATLRDNGNVCSGKPCLDCAVALRAVGITSVYYTLNNNWNDYIDLTDETHFTQLKIYPQDALDE